MTVVDDLQMPSQSNEYPSATRDNDGHGPDHSPPTRVLRTEEGEHGLPPIRESLHWPRVFPGL
jgi:hypothetical protein